MKGVIEQALANIEILGVSINISIPVDIDLNSIINSVVNSFTSSIFPVEVENTRIVKNTVKTMQPVIKLDSDGNVVYKADGTTPVTEMVEVEVKEYQKATLNIAIPYIDITSLCVGSLIEYTSPTTRGISVKLAEKKDVSGQEGAPKSSSAADLVTVILRFVFDALLEKENFENLGEFLIQYAALDDVSASTIRTVISAFRELLVKYTDPDKGLIDILVFVKLLLPIADSLGDSFSKVDFSITDLILAIDNPTLLAKYIGQLILPGAGDAGAATVSWFMNLWNRIVAFFKRIINFFKNMFAFV